MSWLLRQQWVRGLGCPRPVTASAAVCEAPEMEISVGRLVYELRSPP